MNVGDVYQVSPMCFYDDQLGILALHMSVQSVVAGGPTDLQLAAFLDNVWAPLIKPTIPAVVDYIGFQVQKVFPAPRLNAAHSVAHAGVGTATGNPLPTQTAGLINGSSSVPGRSGHARVYPAFPATSHNDTDASPTAGYLTLLDNIAAELLINRIVAGAGAATATLAYGVFSRKLGVCSPFTETGPEDGWATQRRRGFFGRPNVRPF